jgi:hypothetical protein
MRDRNHSGPRPVASLRMLLLYYLKFRDFESVAHDVILSLLTER